MSSCRYETRWANKGKVARLFVVAFKRLQKITRKRNLGAMTSLLITLHFISITLYSLDKYVISNFVHYFLSETLLFKLGKRDKEQWYDAFKASRCLVERLLSLDGKIIFHCAHSRLNHFLSPSNILLTSTFFIRQRCLQICSQHFVLN